MLRGENEGEKSQMGLAEPGFHQRGETSTGFSCIWRIAKAVTARGWGDWEAAAVWDVLRESSKSQVPFSHKFWKRYARRWQNEAQEKHCILKQLNEKKKKRGEKVQNTTKTNKTNPELWKEFKSQEVCCKFSLINSYKWIFIQLHLATQQDSRETMRLLTTNFQNDTQLLYFRKWSKKTLLHLQTWDHV